MGVLNLFRRKKPETQTRSGEATRTAFKAAGFDRLTASWLAGQKAINDELRSDLDALRRRARDLAKNNGYGRKFLRMVSRNVVGPKGVLLQSRIMDAPSVPDSMANAAVEGGWFKWCRRGSADITGKSSFVDMQNAVIRAVARDGETLVREIYGAAAGNPEGFALQHIDVARLDTARNLEATATRNAVVMGVEVDRFMRPVAYWIRSKADASSQSAERIPASEMMHIFLAEDAEQARGIPWMHAVMLDSHDLGEFNRSALLSARRGADTLGFIVSPDGTAAGMSDGQGAEEELLKISAPGTYDVLPEGYDIKVPNAPYPNEVFDPFTKAILRRISSGLDVSYNSLANDLEGVNYSSIRAGVLEERDQWMALQNWFIDAFLEPVFDKWFSRAMLAGVIVNAMGNPLPLVKQDKFRVHEWQPRRWTWVDPLKDQQAAVTAIDNQLASPQQIAAQQGLDLEDVLDAIAAANQMAAAKGLNAYGAQAQKNSNAVAASAAQDAATQQP